MAKRKSMDKWIAEAIADPNYENQLSQITLVHMRGTTQSEIHTWKASTAASTGGADPKAIASLLQDKADTLSQDLPGTQTFNLLAFYGTAQPQGQYIFLVRPETDTMSSGLTTEAPTDAGMRQQSMRWLEAGQGQIFRRQQAQDEYAIRMIQQQNLMIERLMTDRFEAVNVMTDMMMRMANNQHEMRMKELEMERATQERQALMKLAPSLVNTIAGKDVFPQSSADTALIDQIAGVLTEEHIPKILELGLPDVVVAPLMDRVMKAKQAQDKAITDRRSLPKFAGSSEDDISGGSK